MKISRSYQTPEFASRLPLISSFEPSWATPDQALERAAKLETQRQIAWLEELKDVQAVISRNQAERDELTSSQEVRYGASQTNEAGITRWTVYLGREKFSASRDDLYPDAKAFTLNVSTLPRKVKTCKKPGDALLALRECVRLDPTSWASRGLTLAAQAYARGAPVTVTRGDNATGASVHAVRIAVRRYAKSLANPWTELNAPALPAIDVRGQIDADSDEAAWRAEISQETSYAPRENGWATLHIDGRAVERVRLYDQPTMPERDMGEIKPATVQVVRQLSKRYSSRLEYLGHQVNIANLIGRRTTRGDVWLKVVSGSMDGVNKKIWKNAPSVQYVQRVPHIPYLDAAN